MSETALVVPSNLSHNVVAPIETAKHSLTDLAKLYLVTEVAGQSQATLDAKGRDLHRFLAFYHQLYSHDRPEEWFVSVTNLSRIPPGTALRPGLRGPHLRDRAPLRPLARPEIP
jgi:hypothetical protein